MTTETLQVTTPTEREIVMSRVFDAPRELVFEAWTKPELLKRWLGVRNGWELAECEVDLKVGGAYRFVWRGPNGEEMGMGGVYREIVRPERIVCTEVFDDAWYPGEALNTTVLTESAGETALLVTMRYASRDARDGVLSSGMERGVGESYDMLDELLASNPEEYLWS